jgi:hypothetical protein
MRTDVFLHGEKESMWIKGEELGLTGEALRNFSRACYEVKLTLEVNADTGDADIIAVDDRELK